MDRSASLSLLRQLYRELRPTLSMGQKHVYDSSHWKYIVSLAKKEHTSILSKEQLKKLGHLGQNYLSYLKSTRQYVETMAVYKGKGERSATDLAHILGFSMPNEPKLPRQPKAKESTQQEQDQHEQESATPTKQSSSSGQSAS